MNIVHKVSIIIIIIIKFLFVYDLIYGMFILHYL